MCLALGLMLLGCGSRSIDYHEISPEEMERRFPGSNGRAEWSGDSCDIYLLPPEEYPSDACYQAVLKHEQRHCDEGAWHGDEPHVETDCI